MPTLVNTYIDESVGLWMLPWKSASSGFEIYSSHIDVYEKSEIDKNMINILNQRQPETFVSRNIKKIAEDFNYIISDNIKKSKKKQIRGYSWSKLSDMTVEGLQKIYNVCKTTDYEIDKIYACSRIEKYISRFMDRNKKEPFIKELKSKIQITDRKELVTNPNLGAHYIMKEISGKIAQQKKEILVEKMNNDLDISIIKNPDSRKGNKLKDLLHDIAKNKNKISLNTLVEDAPYVPVHNSPNIPIVNFPNLDNRFSNFVINITRF